MNIIKKRFENLTVQELLGYKTKLETTCRACQFRTECYESIEAGKQCGVYISLDAINRELEDKAVKEYPFTVQEYVKTLPYLMPIMIETNDEGTFIVSGGATLEGIFLRVANRKVKSSRFEMNSVGRMTCLIKAI